MTLTGIDNKEIMLDEEGQPVLGPLGDFIIVEGVECWKQDIILEAGTEEGELFYEDCEGNDSYGFSMKDFLHMLLDNFEVMKIRQRIFNKLTKRPELDDRSIVTEVEFDGNEYRSRTSYKLNDSTDAYNMSMEIKGTEVIIND